MKTLLVVALMFIVSLLLVGCQTPEPVVIIKYQPVAPPDSLLMDCESNPPPNMNEYLSAGWSDKEKMLSDSYNNQTNNIGLCNVQMSNLRKWKVNTLEIYSDKTKK